MDGEQFVGYRETYAPSLPLDDGYVFLEFFQGLPKKVIELRSGHEETVGLLAARRIEIRRVEWSLPLGILIIVVGHLYCVVTNRLRQGGARDWLGNKRVCADRFDL